MLVLGDGAVCESVYQQGPEGKHCHRSIVGEVVMEWMTRQSQSKFQSKKNSALENRRVRVVHCIRALPAGMVSSYGAIAKAAGWPGAARQVVRILQQTPGLPWHRVVGSGGAIKLTGENAAEQKVRLRMEGVGFRSARVDMKKYEYKFPKRLASRRKVR